MSREHDSTGPALPPEYQQLPGAALLTWKTRRWEILLDASDYPTGWPAWGLAKNHHEYVAEDGSPYLVVQTGWAWVGQRS
ncbi:hypothetical protein [Hymenobacter psychrophilus]|nr:hypothetical protein [Hymenobacter psychrophilus]